MNFKPILLKVLFATSSLWYNKHVVFVFVFLSTIYKMFQKFMFLSTIYKMFQKFMFVFSLNSTLSNHIYILSNHIYILSNRFYIVSNRVNIGLKSLCNVFNTEQYFFQNFVSSQKFPLCSVCTCLTACTRSIFLCSMRKASTRVEERLRPAQQFTSTLGCSESVSVCVCLSLLPGGSLPL